MGQCFVNSVSRVAWMPWRNLPGQVDENITYLDLPAKTHDKFRGAEVYLLTRGQKDMLRIVAGLIALTLANVCLADENAPLLLRHPTVSAKQIVFVYGGEIRALRARRPGSLLQVQTNPFSPLTAISYVSPED